MAGSARGLKLFSQSIFIPPADAPNKVAACPTADLSAAVSGGNAVYIRRRGGELVSKLTERQKNVQAVAWKSDGKYLAVAWSDGVVRLVGLESPKTVSQIRLYDSAPAATAVTYIGWAKNMVGSSDAWRTVVSDSAHGQPDGDVLDLPQALLHADVEQSLTKLPPLPVSGGSGDDMFVFSTQTSLDFMFRPLDLRDSDSIHVMVLGTADGVIHVSIYDTFVMGTFTVPLPPPRNDGSGAEMTMTTTTTTTTDKQKPLLHLHRHASHSASSTHILLLASDDADKTAVYLAPMDFTFIYSSPFNLALLASKTTTFHKLVRYIQQTLVHMQGEWQTVRELPSRFLASIQDDLQQEPRHKNIVHAFRAAALTGYVSPTLKQWLVDTIAERGHKRWDKAVAGSLQNLSDLIHDSLLPALERAVLALGRLKGLAEFHSCDGIGFSVSQLEPLAEMLEGLIMVASLARVLISAELGLFSAFSMWLRSLIVRLALPGQAEEQADKEPAISMTPVLDYITNHMLTTPLEHFFGKTTTDAEWKADWQAVESYFAQRAGGGGDAAWESLSAKLHEELNKAISIDSEPDFLGILQDGLATTASARRGRQKRAEGEGEVVYMKAFLKLDFLVKLFAARADTVLKDIAQSARQNVGFGPLSRLSVGKPVKKAEVAMTVAQPGDRLVSTDISLDGMDSMDSMDVLAFSAVTVQEETSNVYLFRSLVTTAEGVSTAVATQACVLALGDACRIVDLQFAGARLLLLLLAATKERNARLLAVSVQAPNLAFGDYNDNDNGAGGEGLPVTQLSAEALGLQVPGVCWAASIESLVDADSATAGGGGGGGGSGSSKSKSNPIVRMEVLGPRQAGSDKATGGGGGRTPDTDNDDPMSTARVCLMHADGMTYRVFSLPPMFLMFD